MKAPMAPNQSGLSEYDLQSLLREISRIRDENRFLDPRIGSESARINLNIERLAEIKFLAQRHLELEKKSKRWLRAV